MTEAIKEPEQFQTNFYSLLFNNDEAEKFVNLNKSQEKSIDIYFQCASVQAKIFKKYGVKYQLIRNAQRENKFIKKSSSSNVSVIIENFPLDVPVGIPFHSAHYKLDVLKAFGEGRFGHRPALVDLDLIPVKPIPFDKLGDHDLLVYDITDQMTSDIGRERLTSDLSFLLDRPVSAPVWYGGEFISGSAEAFSALSCQIEKLWPRYRDNIARFSHIGDETIVTAAVCELSRAGLSIGDLGAGKLVTRWWSARTTFRQSSLAGIAEIPFWHLPADKNFIAELDQCDFNVSELQARFAAYVAPKLMRRRLANPLLNFVRNEQKHVARLN